MNHKKLKAIKVFYDGQCPLCSYEIDFYKRQEGSSTIDWVDVTKADPEELPLGLTQEIALARFHVVTRKGELISGGKAFSSLWLSLPKFKWVGRLFKFSINAHLLEAAYRIFLPCRPILQRLMQKKTNRLKK